MRGRRPWAPVVFLVGEIGNNRKPGEAGEGITGSERRTGGSRKERGVPFERKFRLCSGGDKCGLALKRVVL